MCTLIVTFRQSAVSSTCRDGAAATRHRSSSRNFLTSPSNFVKVVPLVISARTTPKSHMSLPRVAPTSSEARNSGAALHRSSLPMMATGFVQSRSLPATEGSDEDLVISTSRLFVARIHIVRLFEDQALARLTTDPPPAQSHRASGLGRCLPRCTHRRRGCCPCGDLRAPPRACADRRGPGTREA